MVVVVVVVVVVCVCACVCVCVRVWARVGACGRVRKIDDWPEGGTIELRCTAPEDSATFR